MEKNILWSANSGARFNVQQQNTIPAFMKPYSNEVSSNGSVPFYTFTGLPQSRESQPNETHNWSNCLPRFRQAFAPCLNSLLIERLPGGTVDRIREQGSGTFETGCVQKRFLVFDQSGDHTTLLYSSEIGARVPCLNSWNPKTPVSHNWLKEEPRIDNDKVSHLGPFVNDEYDEGNEKDDTESEMHEDTEELNALLYSDDDGDYPEDDEETSTGHSPSTMTAHNIHDLIVEKGEEVASSGGLTKKRKLFDGGYHMDNAVMDTASSLKCDARSELEDDAESSCVKGGQVLRESSYVSSKKRSRKEYIHETIRTLQSLIPDGKGKDTMDIIDEAIHYLKSLKAKAIDLGLDTL